MWSYWIHISPCVSETTSAYQKKAESEKEFHSVSSDAKAINEEIYNVLASLTTTTGKVSKHDFWQSVKLFKELHHWEKEMMVTAYFLWWNKGINLVIWWPVSKVGDVEVLLWNRIIGKHDKWVSFISWVHFIIFFFSWGYWVFGMWILS